MRTPHRREFLPFDEQVAERRDRATDKRMRGRDGDGANEESDGEEERGIQMSTRITASSPIEQPQPKL